MHLNSIVLFFLLFGFALTAEGEEIRLWGSVFPLTGGTTPVFTVERGSKKVGHNRVDFDHYRNPNGNLVAAIEATYEADRLSSVRFNQHQLGETSTAVIKDGKVTYSHTKDGKTKQSTEKDTGDLVAAPAIASVIMAKWDDLQAGKAIEITVPLPARRQSFRFKVSKERTWSQEGRNLTEFKMEPANAIYRALGNPGFFVFDSQNRTLLEFRGHTLVKTGDPGNWNDLEGRIVYGSAVVAGK